MSKGFRANEHSSSIPRDEVASAVYSPSKTSETNVVKGKDSRNRELPELLLEVAHRERPFFWNDNTIDPRRLCTDICFNSFVMPLPCQLPPSFSQPPWNALKLVSDFVTTAGAPLLRQRGSYERASSYNG